MIALLTLSACAVLAATLGATALARYSWLDRSPLLGMAVWQALSFSVLAAVVLPGIAVAAPIVPFAGDIADLIHACAEVLRLQYATPGGAAVSATGAVLAMSVLTRAVYRLVVEFAVVARERRRVLEVLALVGRHHDGWNAVVVPRPIAGAYCVPGRRQHVVLTTAAVALLSDAELGAVIAHERAHLRGRHDMVLITSAALQRAFPWVPVFRHAQDELIRLVEMRADDIAARRHERRAIASALVRLAEASIPVATLGAGGSTSLMRIQRLLAPAAPLGVIASLLAGLACTALLATPVALMFAPALAAWTGGLCHLPFPR